MKRMWMLTLILAAGAHGARAELEVTLPATNAPPKPGITVPSPARSGAAPVVKDGDTLKFRNGDLLHGTVVGVAPTIGLRWRHSDVKEPIMFGLDNVQEVQLAPRPPRASRVVHKAVVELTNGDRLAGDVVGLNEKALTLNTWYAGQLILRRPALQRIAFVAAPREAAYVGPTGLEEWTRGEGQKNAWTFRKGALVSSRNGAIGRDVKLPEMANIEFDCGWQGQFYLHVGLGFDQVRQLYNSGGYMLQFNYSNVYLQRYRPQQGSNNLGQNVEIPNFNRKSKAHFSIRINKPKKTITLLVDGQVVRQWVEPDEWVGKGGMLVFVSQGQGQSRISNISVTEWDGRLDSESAAGAENEDLVRLANNDKVSGGVQAITRDQIVFATSFAEMKIPLERVSVVEFAGQKAEKARRQATDVRAVFLDGSNFTLALEKLDENALVGSSENCGRVTGALDAFRSVQFHIYEKAAETADKADDDESEGDQ